MDNPPEQGFIRQWENPSNHRYYQVTATCDLLGDWILVKYWGSQQRPKARIQTVAYVTYAALLKAVEHINKQRLRHGYQLIESVL